MMKKTLIILSLVMFSLGCEKQFLEEEAVTVLTGNFYKTSEGLRSLVNGSYQIFRFKPDYNHGNMLFGAANDCEVFLHNDADRIANGTYAPDAWGPAATGTRMAPQVNTLLGGTVGSTNIVEGMYPAINRCNAFLENYELVSEDIKEEVKDSKGEILFIRAYAYYLLTNVLGDVPLVLSSPREYTTIFQFPKAPIEEIYKVMIQDLREAVEVLPEEGELGRITRPAAAHLLAKLYLHRAQAADWESAEPHLAMLYKGNVPTDLDSSIYYATITIDQKSGETAYGGLAPNFGDLWQIAPNDPSNLSQDYPRDLVSEIMLSAQYEATQQFNGRYEGSQIVHFYNQDFTVLNTGLDRANMLYPRPFRAVGPNDWAYDMYTDKANDSRFYKTYLTEYVSNSESLANSAAIQWNDGSAYFYNNFLKDKFPDRYEGGDAVPGTSKIEYEETCLVYIENSKDEPLDSLWVASQPYLLLARWVAGSPNGSGYFDRDGNGNITGLKPGITIDPDNPVVTDVFDRVVRYRIVPVSGPDITRYGSDAEGNSSLAYLSPAKYVDRNRGQAIDDRGAGAIDIPLIRLAETYLIRAEAYGRQGNFAMAIDDINVLRQRAAYHVGENRSEILASVEPGVLTGRLDIPVAERVAPFTVTADTYDKIMVTGEEWGTGPKAALENYPPTAGSELERFIHFIYNEKAREFIFEMMITEDLHNAGILYDRVYYRDYFGAPPSSTGTSTHPFPLDPVDQGGVNGAIGRGRGLFEKHHTFKAWPLGYLNLLTDETGKPLTSEQMDQYQNPGYN